MCGFDNPYPARNIEASFEPTKVFFRHRISSATLLIISLICVCKDTLGAGFAVMEQSAKELGQAFAGAPTNTEDGSSVYFNPGAMGQIRGRLVTFVGHLVVVSGRFEDDGSSLSPLVGGARLTGGDGGNAGEILLVPNLYYVHELTRRVVLGLGVNTPFALNTKYDADWKGRYHAIDTDVNTVNINPSLALRVSDSFSIGAGLNVQYIDAELTNAIDFGTLCVQSLGPIGCNRLGLRPQEADGQLKLEGDAWGLGYDIGFLYSFSPSTRLGASYRSKITQSVTGNADFTVPAAAAPLTQGGVVFVDTDFRSEVTLPESVSVGIYHRFHPHWAVTADALWMRWSRFQELRIQFQSAQPDSVQTQDWEDTWRYALGVNYFWTPAWTLRIGFAYDETPVPNPVRRIPRAPDNDRFWATAGASYVVSESATVHVGYAHLFFKDPRIDNLSATGDRLVGEYSNSIDIFSLQLDWRF